MNRTKDKSIAHAVRARVLRGGGDRLWIYGDFPGVGRTALAASLSRLVKTGELVRVRRAVYYRPKKTAFGPSRPDPESLVDAALRARGEDAVASGVGAYGRLGLTTQMSGSVTRATQRRVRANLVSRAAPGLAVYASARPLAAQKGIRPEERTALDALRDISRIPDAEPVHVLRRLRTLLCSGRLNYARLARFASAEPPRVRALLGALGEDLQISRNGGRVQDSALRALRDSLNPLTSYAIAGVRAVLPTSATWRIK